MIKIKLLLDYVFSEIQFQQIMMLDFNVKILKESGGHSCVHSLLIDLAAMVKVGNLTQEKTIKVNDDLSTRIQYAKWHSAFQEICEQTKSGIQSLKNQKIEKREKVVLRQIESTLQEMSFMIILHMEFSLSETQPRSSKLLQDIKTELKERFDLIQDVNTLLGRKMDLFAFE